MHPTLVIWRVVDHVSDRMTLNESAQLRAMQPECTGCGGDVSGVGVQRILDPPAPLEVDLRDALAWG